MHALVNLFETSHRNKLTDTIFEIEMHLMLDVNEFDHC